ncbi:HD-GYP domain-containing protein [Tepidimonas charontis]|uniref:Cyclic di-GMP phosphodiesterase response regulator RpfG n=1 Tax=Tepidimonas charontis TaxID=2267262 RepID=A0A554XEW1_9BURK|nr:DUF3391 domain-containing protein [Tepidimonas charontis]TSE34377.1 Cyclic di-GMP phosphodiesterase response regulator RpfG [Tepidimonas charontis]
MTESALPVIPVEQLRVGHYVLLDLGWMDHPFPRNNFRISAAHQIDTIRGLGLTRVRIDPARSELLPEDSAPAVGDRSGADAHPEPAHAADARTQVLLQQRQALLRCERQYHEGTRQVRAAFEQVERAPQAAGAIARGLIGGMVDAMGGGGETALRLLSDVQGERSAQHAMNVAVLSLLLGHALGLDDAALRALGVAALLHDIGKVRLPDPVRHKDDAFTPAQLKAYQEHVVHGVVLAQAMGLEPQAVQAIAQHHEAADGSGFPDGCHGAQIGRLAHIVALVNRYDGLCNPHNPARAYTPHEALARLYAVHKARFDAPTLTAFIRLLGVYPPGSIVQLSDGRYALVQACNATRPLKPQVLVHDPRTPPSEALLLDLQSTPELTIQRSLRADQLPRAALDYLDPRPRYCYFFERALRADDVTAPTGARS